MKRKTDMDTMKANYQHPTNQFTDSVFSKAFIQCMVHLDCGVDTERRHITGNSFDAGVWINLISYEMGFGQ